MLIQNAGSAQPAAPNAPAIQPAPVAPVASAPVASAPAAPTAAQLQRAIQNTNQAMQDSGRSLTFSVDEATKETVVKLMDTQTNQLIGQFPSKQMLAIAEAIGLMQEQLQQVSNSKMQAQTVPGLLIKQEA